MATSFGTTAASRIQLALQSPLQYRCEEITRIIEELGTKELQNALPLLVADLFGVAGGSTTGSPSNTIGMGWGLRTVMHSNEFTDYNVLYQFLHPQGPVFRLLYKLLHDCHLKYEFPLHWLPVRIKQSILKGMVPPFYADKLQLDPQTRSPTGLLLNSFELYIFHFAYHLVNPDLRRVQMNAWLFSDSLYLNLTEAYLSELLPCDRSVVHPSVPYNFGVMQGYSASFGSYGPLHRLPALQSSTRATHTPHLLRQSVLQQSGSPGSLHSSPAAAVPSTRTEIWRSETVAQVFVDFWLSHGESEVGAPFVSNSSPQRLYPLDCMVSQHCYLLPQPGTFKLPLQYPDLLPTGEHIRVVRNLIKHLHYFSNSVTGDHSAMDELRRIIVPSSQAKIYGFLRRTIHHWPLDSSFKFILETWLSYIQPWRYTDHKFRNNCTSGSRTGVESEVEVDGRGGRIMGMERSGLDRVWLTFMAENLLSYTVIFREMLPRFARLDLSTPKNANMLFRVSKVFSQPHLAEFLREVESCLDESLGSLSPQRRSQSQSPGVEHRSGLAAHQATKWSAIVRQQIQDLESPGFQYIPMFGSETRAQVVALLRIVEQAKESAIATQRALEQEAAARSHSQSFISAVKDFFMLSDTTSTDEYSPEERLKVSTFLYTAVVQFSEIFHVDPSEISIDGNDTMPNGASTTLHTDATDSFATPSRSISFGGQNFQMNLTPLASEALSSTPQQWSERAQNIHYEGDPDLLPIRSDESALLVRLLHQIASRLNEMYCGDMARLYYRHDVWGRVARQLLSPPLRVSRYDKRSPGGFSPRVQTALPPRLSLRSLARHKNLAVLAALYVGASLCGLPPILVIFSTVMIRTMIILVKALIEPWLSTSQQAPTFNDILLSDSINNETF